MSVSLYNQYLIADHQAKRIEAMGQGVGTIFFMKQYFSGAPQVYVNVEPKPLNMSSTERRALAVAWVAHYGGDIVMRDAYREGYEQLTVESTAAHGAKVIIDFGNVEILPVTSEPDGDEAEALHT